MTLQLFSVDQPLGSPVQRRTLITCLNLAVTSEAGTDPWLQALPAPVWPKPAWKCGLSLASPMSLRTHGLGLTRYLPVLLVLVRHSTIHHPKPPALRPRQQKRFMTVYSETKLGTVAVSQRKWVAVRGSEPKPTDCPWSYIWCCPLCWPHKDHGSSRAVRGA